MSNVIDIAPQLLAASEQRRERDADCAYAALHLDRDYFETHPHRAHSIRPASPGEIAQSGLPGGGTIQHRVVVRSEHGVIARMIIAAHPNDCRLEPARGGEAVTRRVWRHMFERAPRPWRQMFRDAERFTRRDRPVHDENRHTGFIFPEDGAFALEFYCPGAGWHEASGSFEHVIARADQAVRDERSSAYCADVRITLPLVAVDLTRNAKPVASA